MRVTRVSSSDGVAARRLVGGRWELVLRDSDPMQRYLHRSFHQRHKSRSPAAALSRFAAARSPPCSPYQIVSISQCIGRYGAANRIDDAPELNEDAVSCPLNDAPVMQSDGRIEEIAAERAQPCKRPLLIGSGKLAVSGHVRRENCREFPGLGHGRSFTAEESSTAHRS